MAEYTLTKVDRPGGVIDMYEVSLPDGASSRFVVSRCQGPEALAHWTEIGVRKAQRISDYMKARANG